MPIVRLFANLRALAGSSQLEIPGETVRAVMENLFIEKGMLKSAVFDGDALRPYVRLMVNGLDIELGQGLSTPLKQEDQVTIFPPITGGAA
ncbi:MAG: MoaD/ThiS family protein [Anaerolineaceae bacterium]|nr:MoaD/ThiS family protein [Anaerolineaceae bacterium]